MKKILLATTALAMTAGMAAADVRISGDGRMGAQYNGTTWSLNGRARVSVTLSASGDHGLTFGGTLRAAQSFGTVGAAGLPVPVNNAAGIAMNDGRLTNGSVWIEGAGLRLTMGDINDAVRHRVPVFMGTLGYTGGMRGGNVRGASQGDDAGAGGANSLRADYSFSGVGVSASILGNGNNPAIAASFNGTQMGSLPGFTAAAGALFVTGGATEYWLAATYNFSDITVGGVYNHNGVGGSYRLVADYVMGNLSVGARYANGQAGSSFSVGGVATSYYGIGASYGLGGGARIHGAVGSTQAAATVTTAEVGVTFAF